jgi:hypothetical protein
MARVHQRIDARHHKADEVLHDGSVVQIWAILPDDKERLLEHFAGLGARSRYFRFFGVKRTLTSDDLVRFSELDFRATGSASSRPFSQTVNNASSVLANTYAPTYLRMQK